MVPGEGHPILSTGTTEESQSTGRRGRDTPFWGDSRICGEESQSTGQHPVHENEGHSVGLTQARLQWEGLSDQHEARVP